MKKFEIPKLKDYQNFVKDYREIMKEGKEAEVFLGTEAKYCFRQRDSYELDSTDIGVLMDYCLYPLYVEGDMNDFFVKAIAISLHILLAFEEINIVVEFFLKLQQMFFF